MPSIAHIYADESCQNAHRYMVLGAIVVEAEKVPDAQQRLQAVKVLHNTHGTMKWGKVSRSKLHVYQAYCEEFFSLMRADALHFHSITIDTNAVDHARFNQGSAELGFSKFLYQLLVKIGRIYDGYDFHCYPDKRTTRQTTTELQAVINNGLASRWGITSRPYCRIHFRETEDEELLQVNDVLIGALASRANGHHTRPGASAARCELSAYIHQAAGTNVSALWSTPKAQKRFTTWSFRLGR